MKAITTLCLALCLGTTTVVRASSPCSPRLGGALAAEPLTLWPNPSFRFLSGNSTLLSTNGNELIVRAVNAPKNVWPAAYLHFDTPFDLSPYGEIRVTVTNRTDAMQRIGVKVKAETVQGQLPERGFRLGPNAQQTLCLRLRMEKWVFSSPHGLKGLKRNPHVGDGTSFSIKRTHDISFYLPNGTQNAAFGILKVELAGNSCDMNSTVLDPKTFSPWVDEFGQANFAEWPEKVHSVSDLRTRAEAEDSELAAHPDGIPESDRFGGWAKGPQLKATGFFRTEKVNGKWWLVDPDGHLFFSHGVNCGWELATTGISGREEYFEKLPPREGETKEFWSYHKKPIFRNFYGDPKNAPFWSFTFSGHDLWLKYGAAWRAVNTTNTVRRMKAWGINTTTGTSREVRQMGKVPYVASIGPKSRVIEGANGYWGKLLDPFAPEFAESCRTCAERARALGTNAFCMGWTSNNELSWGVSGATLARDILSSPDGQPAKTALLDMLAKKGLTPATATDEDMRLLGEAVAEKYYSTVRAAIKRVAPNHLYLGDRNDKPNPETLRAASRYLDVITVNTYDYRASVELPKGSEDKPLMVTEFHFGCYDTGYFYASLIPVKDQETRAKCYADYLHSVVDNPNYVGAHWFCWRDCPITGQLGEGANAQCGLVSTTDIPYEKLTSAIRAVSAEMYPRRFR